MDVSVMRQSRRFRWNIPMSTPVKAVLVAGLLFAAMIPILPNLAPWLGTDLAFQSSDNGWADSEVQFKGRDFDSILSLFAGYKSRCERPDAVLQRTTDRPGPTSFTWWFDDFSQPKWTVPLATPHSAIPDLRMMKDCVIPDGSAA